MGLSFSHLLLVLLIVLVLFGRGRISGVMGEIGKGIRAMREGLKGDEDKPANVQPIHTIDQTDNTTRKE